MKKETVVHNLNSDKTTTTRIESNGDVTIITDRHLFPRSIFGSLTSKRTIPKHELYLHPELRRQLQ